MIEMNKLKLNNNFKKLIEDRDIKIGAIADKLGFSRPEMSAYVNGKRYPRAERMKKIAEYLGVKIEDIFFWYLYLFNILDLIKIYETDFNYKTYIYGQI